MENIRRISSQIVFPVSSDPVHKGVITVNSDGTILSVEKWRPDCESYNTEFYNGLIVPGFVNTHCHLELSYLKGIFKEECGMSGFIEQMRANRDYKSENAIDAASVYDSKMYKDGISVVADIINTSHTSSVKKSSKIHYINFIEVFGLNSKDADNVIERAEMLKSEFSDSYITPHALYSISDDLKDYLKKNLRKDDLSTLHYLESDSEEEYYKTGNGVLAEKLQMLVTELPRFISNGKLNSLVSLFSAETKLLLVHNTYTGKKDIEEIKKHFPNHFRVICPVSNHFINRRLPDLNLFDSDKICIGTDSLASNHNLSMIAEMLMLQNSYPDIHFSSLLQWATYNGARALNVENNYGTIEPGKKPGLVLIENFDFTNNKLKSNSISKRLV